MDINIRLEIAPSPEMVTLINALLLFNVPNPTFVGTTKSEIAKNVEAAEKAAAKASKNEGGEPGPEPSKKTKESPKEEVKTAKKNSVTLEELKSLATTLKNEIDFDVKAWLKTRGCVKMGDLKEEDYSDCFTDLMKIAGENNVQTF
jgi:hypothetical protein